MGSHKHSETPRGFNRRHALTGVVFVIKDPLQCVSSKSLCQNKPEKKVLQKLNRDHVTKVPLKNLEKNKKGI